jgi:single-strand DNA-binding protein
MNIVAVCGTLSSIPTSRELPSGDRLVSYEVTVREPDQPTDSVPVTWLDPPARALDLAAGTEVLVVGRVRRRFFRTSAGTGSRTEVVATAVVPTRQRARSRALLQAALDRIGEGSDG